jgi:hypothetical protein
MSDSPSTPTEAVALDASQLDALLQGAFDRGQAVADSTPGAVRFDQGYWACGMEVVQRLAESFGQSQLAALHSPPHSEEGQTNHAFHNAQALAYHTIALTIMVHELDCTPEEAILRFERLLYALSQQRFGPEDEPSMLFPYTPTGLCSGSPERTEHAEECGCGGEHGGDTLDVVESEILTALRASYDRVKAADENFDRPEAPRRYPSGGTAEPLPPFDPSLN